VCEVSDARHADEVFSSLSPYLATLDSIGLEAGLLSEFLVRRLQTKGVQATLMKTPHHPSAAFC
jgi:DTW domain-containing protein YfiP